MNIFISLESGEELPVEIQPNDRVYEMLEKASLDTATSLFYEGIPLKGTEKVLSYGISGGDVLEADASKKLRARQLLLSNHRMTCASAAKMVQAILNKQLEVIELIAEAEYYGDLHKLSRHLNGSETVVSDVLLRCLPWTDKHLEAALTTALFRNDGLSKCKLLIKYGAKCKITGGILNSNDEELAYVACHNGAITTSPEAASLCLKAGKFKAAKAILKSFPEYHRHEDEFGNLPIHIAADAKFGTEQQNLNVIKFIMDSAPDPVGLLSVRTSSGSWTPLHVATFANNSEIVKYFLGIGSQTDILKDRRFTALHLAAGHASPLIIEMLIAAGAQLDAVDKAGRTPYDIATQADRPENASLLFFEKGKCVKAAKECFF